MTWREDCAPIIAETIRKEGRQDLKKLRRALTKAYPFGERKWYPYKAWLKEVKHQLGGGLRADRKGDTKTIDMFKRREK